MHLFCIWGSVTLIFRVYIDHMKELSTYLSRCREARYGGRLLCSRCCGCSHASCREWTISCSRGVIGAHCSLSHATGHPCNNTYRYSQIRCWRQSSDVFSLLSVNYQWTKNKSSLIVRHVTSILNNADLMPDSFKKNRDTNCIKNKNNNIFLYMFVYGVLKQHWAESIGRK